jgi:hypothetical protein
MSSTRLHAPPELLTTLAPAIAAVLAVFAVASFGATSPWGLALLAPAAVLLFTVLLTGLPLVLFWVVPLSLHAFVYLPLMHYEALVLVLAVPVLGRELPAWRSGGWRLPAFEGRYLLFLASILPGFVVATSAWRFVGTLKIFVIGLMAFELARRGGRRFGHASMLWGPAGFLALGTLSLMANAVLGDVPLFRSAEMRAHFSSLPWGSSNYIAAVIVLCLPGLALLVLTHPRGSAGRWLGIAITGGVLAAILFTTSRGGFLLAAAYLLALAGRARRMPWLVLGVPVAVVLALLFTPFGQNLLERFVDARSWLSMSFRVAIWGLALARGMSHLPFGVGAGQGVLQSDALQTADPHNFLLFLFSEMGPLTLALWLWTIAALRRRAIACLGAPETRGIGAALRDMIVLALANSMFEPTLNGNLYHLLFWWLAGTLVGSAEAVEARREIEVKPPATAPAGA